NGAPQSIGIRDTTTVTVATGSHTVVLSGVAGNCTVANGTSRTVNVPASGADTASFSISCTATPGSLDVTVSTTGGTQDPDGYTVTVSGTGGASQHIATNGGRVTFDNLAAGDHTVTLSDLASNCSVSGGASKTVTVPAGSSTSTSFAVDCPTPPPPTGSLTVTTNTSGGTPDPDGYTVSVSGDGSQHINNDDTVTFFDLAAGSHNVTLSDIAPNCSV